MAANALRAAFRVRERTAHVQYLGSEYQEVHTVKAYAVQPSDAALVESPELAEEIKQLWAASPSGHLELTMISEDTARILPLNGLVEITIRPLEQPE